MLAMSPLKVDGGQIRRRRLQAGLSQEQLARRTYISTWTVHRLESGKSMQARELTLISLANALECEPSDLLAGEQNPDSLPGGRGNSKRAGPEWNPGD
jgi:transcriptional regulator with XRE-family HTH domain